LDQLFNSYQGERTLLGNVGAIYMKDGQIFLIKQEGKIMTQHLSFPDFKKFFIGKSAS
jgi:hypothetical protein